MVPTQITSQTSVDIQDVQVKFGDVYAVDNVSIQVKPGEFFTLLGPSGCGKTTLLRSIAGFVNHTGGSISIGNIPVEGIPPHKRDAAMVFQSYAIFPHLNVKENIAYGLKAKKISKEETEKRINEVLKLVNLEGYEERMPRELSGGQQQRVVIARAVVVRPSVLLMDEPLANLDAKLRVRLREELKELQKSLGITTIYVTHDQEEALSLSDRIAVMSSGKVLQCATPEEIYEQPTDIRVARFIGEGTFIRGKNTVTSDISRVAINDSDVNLVVAGHGFETEGQVWIGIRPQDIVLAQAGMNENLVQGTVLGKTYYGAYVRYRVECGFDEEVIVEGYSEDSALAIEVGSTVSLYLDPKSIMVFQGEQEAVEL